MIFVPQPHSVLRPPLASWSPSCFLRRLWSSSGSMSRFGCRSASRIQSGLQTESFSQTEAQALEAVAEGLRS